MLKIPGFVSAAEASKRLGGVSTQTLAKWARAGTITARELPGGQYVYEEKSLNLEALCSPVAGGTEIAKVDGRKNRKKGK